MTRMLLALLIAIPIAAQNAETMMQAAGKKEVVDGDLNGAIKQYAAIVSRYAKSDRAVTAKALIRMAECYQKMGDAEARKLFEQVVREYSDQKDAVAEARAHLGSGTRPARQMNTLVWGPPKADDGGTVSLDGRYLSATDWDSGDLIVHDLASGPDRYLTHTGQQKGDRQKVYAEESAISKDGKLVAYAWFDEKSNPQYQLWVANATGDANPRRLFGDPDVKWLMPHDWSPDGKWIVVQVQRRDKGTQLGLVSAVDGTYRLLKSASWRGIRRAIFSPDGRWLGYDMCEAALSADRDVFVVAVDGSREGRVVEHRGNDEMAGWSPDGKWLLFTSNRAGSMDLWAVPFVDGKGQGTSELLKPGFGERGYPMGVTPNGALYYGVDKGGAGLSSIQVASFDVSTGKLTSSPTDLTHGSIDSSPAWSPDSKELAYVSQRGQLNSPAAGDRFSALVIRSDDTGASRELQPELTFFFAPSWSPDKRSFLVQGRDLQGRTGIFQIDAQSGAVRTVLTADKELATSPVWSPDGKRFYYNRRPWGPHPAYYAFVEHDLATGAERELLRRLVVGGLRLSPDGQYIGTPSIDPATNSRVLLLIPTSGGEPRVLMSVASGVKPEELSKLFAQGETIGIVTWDPDSRSLLVTKGTTDRHEFWRVPIDGGAPRKLGIPSPERWPLGSISPDQKHIATVVSDPATPHTTEIWTLENFLPKAAK
jgi:Tol biopolymer transport system component